MSLPLPEVASCYFCDVAASRTDGWNVVERTDTTMTVLNGRQFEVGQCIVVPLRHAPTLLDVTRDEMAAVMDAAQRIARRMAELYTPEGILLYQNNGVGSAQEMPHFHLHVVPRRLGSDWGPGPPHLARFAPGSRPAHLDHEIVTDEKLRTVAELREVERFHTQPLARPDRLIP